MAGRAGATRGDGARGGEPEAISCLRGRGRPQWTSLHRISEQANLARWEAEGEAAIGDMLDTIRAHAA